MVNDLKNGIIDVAVQPYPYAIYLAKSNCDYIIVGQRFIIDYFAIAFSQNASGSLYFNVTQVNLDLYLAGYHRNLENKFVLVSSTATCDYSADIPLKFMDIGGLWVSLVICTLAGFIGALIYNKKCKRLETKIIGATTILKSVDLKQAAEIDLLSKFESQLISSEHKLIQKIKDFQIAMVKNSQSSSEFKETLNSFAQKFN